MEKEDWRVWNEFECEQWCHEGVEVSWGLKVEKGEKKRVQLNRRTYSYFYLRVNIVLRV